MVYLFLVMIKNLCIVDIALILKEQDPMYYIPNRSNLSADETFGQFGDELYCIVNGVLEPTDAHVYQPLELE